MSYYTNGLILKMNHCERMSKMNIYLEKLDKIVTEITKTRETVADGAFVDIAEIHKSIEKICYAINKSPPDDDGRLELKVLNVISDLNLLSEELKQQQRAASSDLEKTIRGDAKISEK